MVESTLQTTSIYKSDTYKNSLLPNGGKEFLYTTNYQQVTDYTSHHTSSTLSLVYRGRYPLHLSDLPRFSCETVEGLSTDHSFHISVFPKTTRHRQLFPFFRVATQGFLKFALRRVLCGAGLRPCRAATQGFVLISLRRVLLLDEPLLGQRAGEKCLIFIMN